MLHLNQQRSLRLFAILSLLLLFAISDAQYVWRKRACLPEQMRTGNANFVLDNKAYVVGGGFSTGGYTSEVWEYDASTNTWTQKNNFPVERGGYDVFVINDTAYVGLGIDAYGAFYTDFWKYDVNNDRWISIASFPGDPRYLGMAFAMNGMGYVGCGFNGNLYNDFYQYNPATDTWTRKADFLGDPRQTGFGIALGNYGYMGLGWDGASESDVYRYDPSSDSWTRLHDFPGPARLAPAYFLINDAIYISAGRFPFPLYDDCWMYDLANDNWIQQEGFECIAPPRSTNFGFNLNGHGYIFGGDLGNGNFINDLLEFGPYDTTFVTRVHVLGNDTFDCSNFSRVLSTGNSCTLWSTGVTAAKITVTSPGTYWAYWADSCGMVSDTINIQGVPTPVNLGNDTTYCGQFTRILSTGNPATVWNTGATASQITASTPGVYWATISNVCGTVSDTIHISQNPVPVVNLGEDTSLCAGETLLLNAANANSTYWWQDNSTDSTYNVTGSGVYSVTVTNNFNCSTSDSISAVYYTPPIVINLGNDTTYCGLFTRVLATGNPATLWSTGIRAAQITVDTAGSYWATVFAGCADASDTIQLKDKPAPVVNLGNDTTICEGQGLILNATNANATYQWQNNSTGPTDTVTRGGTYSVTVTLSGCTTSGSVAVAIDSLGPVMLQAHPTTICADDSTLVCAPNIYPSYQWNVGGNGNCVEAKAAGDYYVTVTDSHGCTVQSNPLAIAVYPVPSVSVVIEGDTLSSYGAVTYQWILNGTPIPGATSTVWIAQQAGLYSLEITDSNGCSETSQQFVVTGIDEVGENPVLLYPNPNSAGNVRLSAGSELMGSMLELFDEEGQIVFQSEIRSPQSEITTEGLPSGVYYLRISSPNVTITKKLVRL